MTYLESRLRNQTLDFLHQPILYVQGVPQKRGFSVRESKNVDSEIHLILELVSKPSAGFFLN